MNEIFLAYNRTLRSLFQPQIWLRLLIPWFLAFLFSVGILVLKWSDWQARLFNSFFDTQLIEFMTGPFTSFWPTAPVFVANMMAGISLLVLFIVSFYVVSILVISNFIVPLLIPVIVVKDYPDLQKLSRGLFIKALKNTVFSLLRYAIGFIVTLPFWIIPGGPFFMTLCWNGYLAAKIFPYDVLQDWASEEELNTILATTNSKQWMLGLLNSMILLIPGLNILATTLLTLSFIHLNLEALQNLRKSHQLVGMIRRKN